MRNTPFYQTRLYEQHLPQDTGNIGYISNFGKGVFDTNFSITAPDFLVSPEFFGLKFLVRSFLMGGTVLLHSLGPYMKIPVSYQRAGLVIYVVDIL